MWMENIELAFAAHADSLIPVRGSAWIDQGPQGSWMDFKNYSLFYQKQGATAWKPIVTDSSVKIRHSILGVWNTGGLDTGTYRIRLLVKNNLSDSIEDIKVVTLLPSANSEVKEITGNYLSAQIFPNPFIKETTLEFTLNRMSYVSLAVYDELGRLVWAYPGSSLEAGMHQVHLDGSILPGGTLYARIATGFGEVKTVKLVHDK
jgi:hypothetical protein